MNIQTILCIFLHLFCWQLSAQVTDSCTIFNVFAEAHDCDENGNFLVDIGFDAFDTGETFKIRGNGHNYGTFEYGQTFYTIGPISGDEPQTLEFTITDLHRDSCVGFIILQHPGCEDGGGNVDSCFITDFVVDSIFQDSIGRTFAQLSVEVDSAHLNGSTYSIVGCGFVSWQSRIIVEFDDCCYEATVTDVEGNSCSKQLCIEFPDTTACTITNLFIDSLTCQQNGAYFTTIDFDYENAGNDFFDLFINGEFVNFYGLDELPIRLENLELRDSSLTVSVCINDNPDCCAEVTMFDIVDCENDINSNCRIDNPFLSNIECQDNEMISGTIDFEYTEPNNEFFDLYINNDFWGFYRLDELPLQLDSLPFSFDQTISIDVCINDNPNCCANFVYSINIPELRCYARYVWPGDINLDNIVDHRDLLWLGYAFNSTGLERENASLEWLPQIAPIWMEGFPFTSGVHSRSHADTNGDGIVNELDLEALFVNYGKTHGLTAPLDSIIATPNDPVLQFNLPPDDSVNNGQLLSVPITLGTIDNPIDDIYGLNFTLQFNPQVINPETIEIEYPTSWFGESEVNVLTIDKTFAERGIIQIAITRNDQNNVSGYGEIARFVGMIDDIIGYGKVEVEVTEIQATMLNGQQIPLNTYKLEQPITSISTIDNQIPVTLFPNPVTTQFTIHAPQFRVEAVHIYNMTGQLLETYKNTYQIATRDWQNGVYLVEIQTDNGTVFRKVVKQ